MLTERMCPMKQIRHFRRIPLLLALVLLFSVCLTACAEEAESEFTIEGTTLVSYNGPGGEVTVPEGIEKIGTWAFKNSRVTKVNLPETLKELDSFCFFSCSLLTDITLPASLQYLEYDPDGMVKSQVFAFIQACGRSRSRKAILGINPWTACCSPRTGKPCFTIRPEKTSMRITPFRREQSGLDIPPFPGRILGL